MQATSARSKSLRDPEFHERLQQLRRTDNVTNLYYLARTWAVLAAAIGGTIWFHQSEACAAAPFWAKCAVALAAIVVVGAGQHQLTGLAHEASHHTLFRNRIWNDLASDWFCMFPMFSCTHHYRLQHMAHHQFVNDPERDPDVSQLRASGHWLRFPIARAAFLGTLARQLWLPNLVKYIRVRAKYNSIGTDKNPYQKKGARTSKIPVLVGVGYMLGLVAALTALRLTNQAALLLAVPAAMWGAAAAFYAFLPASMYHQSRVRPTISNRSMTLMRITFITILFTSIAWASRSYGLLAPGYFLLLWVAPIFTSFSFFMVLRQIVQHGNGGRGWLTNTRVFRVNPIIEFCVFPMGQDYHLPHHMYATVPHYRLPQLHALLLEHPEYRREAVEVEGYFLPKERPPVKPTVLDVLSRPTTVPANGAFIDNSVLEGNEVEEKEQILQEGRISAGLEAEAVRAPLTAAG